MADFPAPLTWLHADVPVPAMTPAEENIFFGFHDITPWSPKGEELIGLRLPVGAASMDDTVQDAEVCLWNPKTGALRNIGSTNCWNFQQAARQQWVPEAAESVIFNTSDENARCVAVMQDLQSGAKRQFDGGIYAISQSGNWAISTDFDVLTASWPAYGYASLRGQQTIPNPETSGLWRTDLKTGKRELIVSLHHVLAKWGMAAASEEHFLTHPSISPDSQKITFLHRFFAKDEGSFTRLLICNADGSDLASLAEEKVSHFDWLDPQTLLVWARFTGGGLARMRAKGTLNAPLIRPLVNLARRFTGRWKKRVLSESYFALPVDGQAQRKRFGWPQLDADGHPMVARKHDWVVTDMYPNSSGKMPLILWNRRTNQRVDVAILHDGTMSSDSDAKCDLHPRWNRDETKIAVDCCAGGRRRIAIFDVSAIVGVDQ